MSCTSPLTVAISTLPFADADAPPDAAMCGSRWATAVFIVCADCSTNGSCMRPSANSSPTVRMPASRYALMISSGGCVVSAVSRSASMPSGSPSTMRRSSRSSTLSAASSSADAFVDVTPSNSAISVVSGS